MFFFPFANGIISPYLKLTILNYLVVDWSDKDQGFVLQSQIVTAAKSRSDENVKNDQKGS